MAPALDSASERITKLPAAFIIGIGIGIGATALLSAACGSSDDPAMLGTEAGDSRGDSGDASGGGPVVSDGGRVADGAADAIASDATNEQSFDAQDERHAVDGAIADSQ